MPTIEFGEAEIDCEEGELLRDVLLAAGESPHNGSADAVNCRGHGTCGTCAVEIEGDVSEPTTRERARLSVPPHDPDVDRTGATGAVPETVDCVRAAIVR